LSKIFKKITLASQGADRMGVGPRILFCVLITGLFVGSTLAQSAVEQKPKPSEAGQVSPMGGVKTGAAHAPVLDNQHRPITAGGFVTEGQVVFRDIAEKAGLTNWQHRMGNPEKDYILDTVGSGVGLIDYDNDGWLDIYMVNGSTYEAISGKANPPHAALFHNNHDGTFTDVAAKAGVTNDRWGFGIAVADYDNDGWPDLYVTNFGKNRLFHNNRDGTLPMWPRRLASRSGIGLRAQPGVITMVTGSWTYLSRAMCTTT
jgi:hypothetical protein